MSNGGSTAIQRTADEMSRPAQQIMTVIVSLAALMMLTSGELRPAGVRTAFEMLAGGSKERILVTEAVRSE